MKISIVLPDLRGGGVERVGIDLAREFKRTGHEVEFVLMRSEGKFLDQAMEHFNVIDLGINRFRQVPAVLARYLRKSRPDVLMVAMWPLTVLAPLARIISRCRCRLLISEHGILSAQYRSWGQFHRLMLRGSAALGYRLADARVGVSNGVVQDVATLAFMRPDRFEVIHNPVEPHSDSSSEVVDKAHALWGVPCGARLLTVGRFKTVKNHALLLMAFARLRDLEDARLMLLGEGELEEELKALSASLGVTESVIFAGFHSDPTPFYRTADLFVLSSDYEGFGNVIVEALACGTPVVSTDCPSGPREILQDGKYGHLVPVGDEQALASVMLQALEEKVDHELLRRRARDFAPEVAAKRYLELME